MTVHQANFNKFLGLETRNPGTSCCIKGYGQAGRGFNPGHLNFLEDNREAIQQSNNYCYEQNHEAVWLMKAAGSQLSRQSSHTRRRFALRHEYWYMNGGDAYRLMLFQFVPGALHLDIHLGRKPRADPITRRGTCLNVLTEPG
jgi:hypothetical protein